MSALAHFAFRRGRHRGRLERRAAVHDRPPAQRRRSRCGDAGGKPGDPRRSRLWPGHRLRHEREAGLSAIARPGRAAGAAGADGRGPWPVAAGRRLFRGQNQRAFGREKIFVRTDAENTSLGNGFSLMGLYRPGLTGTGNDMTVSVDPRSGIALKDLWEGWKRPRSNAGPAHVQNGAPRRIASICAGRGLRSALVGRSWPLHAAPAHPGDRRTARLAADVERRAGGGVALLQSAARRLRLRSRRRRPPRRAKPIEPVSPAASPTARAARRRSSI